MVFGSKKKIISIDTLTEICEKEFLKKDQIMIETKQNIEEVKMEIPKIKEVKKLEINIGNEIPWI